MALHRRQRSFYIKIIKSWQKEQEQFPNRKILNYKCIYQLIDNPIFNADDIKQIKAGYDPESVNYKRDILGQFADQLRVYIELRL